MGYRDTKAALRSLAGLAAPQGGYFTAAQAMQIGYDRSHLSYHVSRGNFEHVGRGLYRLPMLPPAEHDDLIRLWFWSRGRDDTPRGVFSHQTALTLFDLAEFIPTDIHMTVPVSFRKTPPDGCILHRAELEPSDHREFDAFRVTTPHRTLLDLARDATMPREQFENAVQEAMNRGLLQPSQVRALMSIDPAMRRADGDR